MRLFTGDGKISADRLLVGGGGHLLSYTTTWRGGIVVVGTPPCTVSLSDYSSKEPDYITQPKTKKNETRIFPESLSTQTDFHTCLDIFRNYPNQEAGKEFRWKIKQRFPLVPFFFCS